MAGPDDATRQVEYETLDDGRIARIWLNRPMRRTPSPGLCWCNSTRRSVAPRLTTRSGW
jgi:hypothetical protein